MENATERLNSFSLPAPAKVNRFLHIIGRRTDGYHLLETLFQFLDVGDHLHFTLREDGEIILVPLTAMDIPNETNLVYRIARALQEVTGTQAGVTIQLNKTLPIGGGLGGGSSNAATTLLALNHLWAINWPLTKLLDFSLSFGADIPVFIYGRASLAEGVGEKLTAIELNEPWYVVITPSCQVATVKMYADPQLTRNTPSLRIETLAKVEIENMMGELKNDFEPVVRSHYPEVAAAMEWLSNYGKARLSGSGASVFSCFNSEAEASVVAKQLPPRFKGFVAKGMNKSLLISVAESLGFQFNDWGVAKR